MRLCGPLIDIEPMATLIRALIGFYWDEAAYNSHWGGGSVIDLLRGNAQSRGQAAGRGHDFDWVLQELPYPD